MNQVLGTEFLCLKPLFCSVPYSEYFKLSLSKHTILTNTYSLVTGIKTTLGNSLYISIIVPSLKIWNFITAHISAIETSVLVIKYQILYFIAIKKPLAGNVVATNPDNQSLMSETLYSRSKNLIPTLCLMTYPHVWWHMCMHTHTQIHKYKQLVKI